MQKRMTARTAAALLAALLLVFFLSAGPGLAVDVSRSVSLDVGIGDSDGADELLLRSVVVDLYLVGQAVDGGPDEIALRPVSEFAQLDLSSGRDRGALRRLTDAAMEIALSSAAPVVSGAVPGDRIAAGSDGKPLAAGMYLVVPHGVGLAPEEYVVRAADDTGEVHILTVAGSADGDYTFQPQLLTLPIRAGTSELYDCDVLESGGDYVYNARILFKYEKALLRGRIKLTKTLLSHAEGDTPSFLFSVDVRQGSSLIFSNVYTLTFDAAGQKSLLIEDLPVGAEVTVTEVYSGPGYELVSPTVQTAVVAADEIVEVSFANRRQDTDVGGGSLINRFAYAADTGWSWQQLPASEG